MFERPFYGRPPYQAYDGYVNYGYGGPYPQNWSYQEVPLSVPAYSQTPFDYFAKPAQPNNWPGYPNPSSGPSPQPKPNVPNGLLTYFQDKDGHVDLDKMFSTVGQFANTFQQITPVVKQVGSLMKNLK